MLEIISLIIIAFLVVNLWALMSLANRIDEITETQRKFKEK